MDHQTKKSLAKKAAYVTVALTGLLLIFSMPAQAGSPFAGWVNFLLDIPGRIIALLMSSILSWIKGFVDLPVTLLTNDLVNRPIITGVNYMPLAGILMKVIMPLVIFAILFTSIKLIAASTSPGERSAAKTQLQNLLIGLVVIPFSPLLYQILIDICHNLTIDLLGRGDPSAPGVWVCPTPPGVCPNPPTPPDTITSCPSCGTYVKGTYREVVPGGETFSKAVADVYSGVTGTGFVFIYCCTMIVVLFSIIVIFIRHIMVALFGILMPLTVFLYMFDFTKSIGRKFLKYSITWAFVPIAMATWIIIGGIVLTNTVAGLDPNTGTFMCIVFLGMIVVAPLQVTGALETLGALMTSAGQMTGGMAGVGLVAAGQVMQAKDAESLVTAGMKVGAGASAKGLKGLTKGVKSLAKSGSIAAKVGNLAKAGGVMGRVAQAGIMVGGVVSGAARIAGKGISLAGRIPGVKAAGKFASKWGGKGLSLAGKAGGKVYGVAVGAARAGMTIGGYAKAAAKLPLDLAGKAVSKSIGAARWAGQKASGLGRSLAGLASMIPGAGLARAGMSLAQAGAQKANAFGKAAAAKIGSGASKAYNAMGGRAIGAAFSATGGRMASTLARGFSDQEPDAAQMNQLKSLAKVAKGKGSMLGRLSSKLGSADKALGRGFRKITGLSALGRGLSSAGSWTKGKASNLKTKGGAMLGGLGSKALGKVMGTSVGQALGKAGAGARQFGRNRLADSLKSLNRSAGGRAYIGAMNQIAGMKLGGAMSGTARAGLMFGGAAIAAGAMGAAVPALAPLLAAGVPLLAASQALKSSGVGVGIAAAIKANPTANAFFQGLGHGGALFSKESGELMRAAMGKGHGAAFMMGKVGGAALGLAVGTAGFMLGTMPRLGAEFAMTGGLSLAFRGAAGGVGALKSVGSFGSGLTAFDDALKGRASSSGTGQPATGQSASGGQPAGQPGAQGGSQGGQQQAQQPGAQPAGASAQAGTQDNAQASSGDPAQAGQQQGQAPAASAKKDDKQDDKKEAQDKEREYGELKEHMRGVFSGGHRHGREKGSGEQLEEMLEDRDERPSK